jgi:multidrug resistance efflux pump
MKHWNLFYWLVFPLAIWLLYQLNSRMVAHPDSFLGFSESEQIELNLPVDIKIDSVFVHAGDLVKKGTPLMYVINREQQESRRNALVQKDVLQVKEIWNKADLQMQKSTLLSEMGTKLAALQTKKKLLEEEVHFYHSLLSQGEIHPNAEVVSLENEIEEVTKNYRSQLQQLDMLLSKQTADGAEMRIWDEKIASIQRDEEGYLLLAPFDGVVGNLSGKVGENKHAFSSLVTFFRSAPTMVTGYVDERFDVEIQPGDSVLVQSVYQGKGPVRGEVVNKGFRIVEIPEKFSKVPGVKQYGIEVFIEIPVTNAFLQKEVLKIGLSQ